MLRDSSAVFVAVTYH